MSDCRESESNIRIWQSYISNSDLIASTADIYTDSERRQKSSLALYGKEDYEGRVTLQKKDSYPQSNFNFRW